MRFNVGDTVRCINNRDGGGGERLHTGDICTVADLYDHERDDRLISVFLPSGDKHTIACAFRFELVTPAAQELAEIDLKSLRKGDKVMLEAEVTAPSDNEGDVRITLGGDAGRYLFSARTYRGTMARTARPLEVGDTVAQLFSNGTPSVNRYVIVHIDGDAAMIRNVETKVPFVRRLKQVVRA